MKRGLSASSERASRSLLMAVFRPCSKEDGQDLKGAILDFEADAGFAEFAGKQVGLIGAEAHNGGKLWRGGHEISPAGKDETLAQKV
jgi:hypothetical protein